ncbi:hypothetical protein EDD15DRAFT_2117719, partial [Pisolithus albus]
RVPLQSPQTASNYSTELALSMFIALEHSSESTYAKIQQATQRAFPTSELPTFHQTKRLLANLSGVTSVVKDMCVNSCAAF